MAPPQIRLTGLGFARVGVSGLRHPSGERPGSDRTRWGGSPESLSFPGGWPFSGMQEPGNGLRRCILSSRIQGKLDPTTAPTGRARWTARLTFAINVGRATRVVKIESHVTDPVPPLAPDGHSSGEPRIAKCDPQLPRGRRSPGRPRMRAERPAPHGRVAHRNASESHVLRPLRLAAVGCIRVEPGASLR